MQFYSPELTQELEIAARNRIPNTQVDSPDQTGEFLQVAPILIPGEYGKLRIHKDVTLLTLLRLWNYQIGPDFPISHQDLECSIMQLFSESHVMLMPLAPEIQEMLTQTALARPDANTIILHRSSTDLSMYEVAHGKTWRMVKQTFPDLQSAQYELFGDLQESTLFTRDTEIHDQVAPFQVPALAQTVLRQLHDVTFEVVCPPKTDILILHCEGSQQAREAFLQFWGTEDHRRWMLQVGRQMNYQSIDDRTWRVFFRPALPEAAMPIAIFRGALFWNAVRTLFMSMHTAEGLPVKIKLFGRTLCQVSLSFDLACETFLLALQHIRQLHPRRGNPSLHASGKRCGDICTIRDIHSRLTGTSTVPVLHIGMPISGGDRPPSIPLPRWTFTNWCNLKLPTDFFSMVWICLK